MNLLHSILLLASAGGAIYFFMRKKVDPLLLGFCSTLIYFSPGLVGSIGFSYGVGDEDYRAAVVPEATIVMLTVIACLIAGTWIADHIPFGNKVDSGSISGLRISKGLLALSLVGVFVSLETVGKGYLCQEKNDVLARLDIWYYVAAYGASSAVVTAFSERNRVCFFSALAIVLVDILLGFRSAAAMAICGTLLVYTKDFFRSQQKMRTVAIILALGVAFFVYKQLAWNVKYIFSVPCPPIASTDGTAAEITAPIVLRFRQIEEVAKLAVSENIVVSAFANSEPMVTQAVLNEVVRRDFKTNSRYLLDQLLSALPGAKTIFGIDVRRIPSFNTLFQNTLFPKATFGMANNPWAQAYAAGGIGMVALFAAGYVLGLGLLALVFRNSGGAIQGTVAILSAWWAFYFHRNDLLVQAGIMKMVIYILVCAWIISYGLNRLTNRTSKQSPNLKG